MVTHLEPDILKCEVKWALGNTAANKANDGDGILAGLFQTINNHAIKVLDSICQQIWKTQQWPQNWKSLIFIQIPKKGSTEECTNYQTIAHPNARKVMLKTLQARLPYY